MRRSRTHQFILMAFVAILTLFGVACSGDDDKSTDDSKPSPSDNPYIQWHEDDENLITLLDGHMVCAGEETIISSGGPYSYENENLEAQRTKLFESGEDGLDRIFGKEISPVASDDRDTLEAQLNSIIDTMNPLYSPASDAPTGTPLLTPAKCWVEDPDGIVLLGTRPENVTTTTVSGPPITAPVSGEVVTTTNPYIDYDSNDPGSASNVDGHLVCAGEETILSSGFSDYNASNANYAAQLNKLLETTTIADAFGLSDSSTYPGWTTVFQDQLESIIAMMNGRTYILSDEAGTPIKTPAKCWVEALDGSVILGVRPEGVTPPVITGPSITAPQS